MLANTVALFHPYGGDEWRLEAAEEVFDGGDMVRRVIDAAVLVTRAARQTAIGRAVVSPLDLIAEQAAKRRT